MPTVRDLLGIQSNDAKNSKDRENAEKIQDFLNKYDIHSKDLNNSKYFENEKRKRQSDGVYNQEWQGYSWVTEATQALEDRPSRYRDYRDECKVPELDQSLNIYSDNATQFNIHKMVMEIESDNSKIVETLEKLFFENLDMNGDLWKIVRNTCKFGDEFAEIIVDDKENPKNVISIERIKKPENMRRIEKEGNLIKFQYVLDEKEEKTIDYQPWEIVHFRIDDEEFSPYGRSIFEAGRKTWKKLSLMEDAMMIYRLSRAPERRVFYVDVGNISSKEANKYIEQLKRQFRKKQYINPNTGEVDEKANILGTDEDFYIPVRQGSSGTRIETLPGGQNLGEIDDVKYFRDQVLRSMGVPAGYLGGTTEGAGTYDPKSYLSNQEIQFSRTIERVQRLIIKGLEKIAIIQLALQGFPAADMKNFKIKLTPPSNVDQMMDIEIRNAQFGLIQSIKSIEGFLPNDWIYKEILGMNDHDINKIKLLIQMEAQMQAQLQAIMGGEGSPGGGSMGGGGGGMGGGNIAPAEAGGPAEGGFEGGGEEGGGAEGAAEAPPSTGGGAGGAEEGGGAEAPMEFSGKTFVEFDGGKWLMENSQDIAKLLKYIKLYEKVNKDNNSKKVYEHTNSLTRMTVKGEFRGLLEAKKSSKTTLSE